MTRRNAQASGSHGSSPWRLDEHPYFLPGGNRAVPPATRADFGHLDHRTQVLACVELVKREGLDFLVLNQTRPDIGVPVARVIVPGMRHFYRRFAPGRLYDVPVKIGLRDGPILESELNPYLPPT
jgi:ribosomal protein S12 methylthiotransferase accessory factor